MKLNKKIITIIITILLIITLTFFSFIVISKSIINEKNLETTIQEFDFHAYLLSNEIVKENIDKYNNIINMFDYLDNNEIKIIKKKYYNNIVEKNSYLVYEKDIEKLIDNSVFEYENQINEEIYEYVKDDIYLISSSITNNLNNFNNYYNVFIFFSSDIFIIISLLVIIAILVIIIIINKRKGLLIDTLILLTYSYVIYYINYNFSTIIDFKNNIYLDLSYIYIVCFIVSFILLLKYILSYIKQYLRDRRIKYYIDSWK